MNSNPILSVLHAADGKIVGRIRTQKVFFLLEELGLNSNFKFSYHHYGPYSEELSRQLHIRSLFKEGVIEEFGHTNFGAKYSIYNLKPMEDSLPYDFGHLELAQMQSAVTVMKAASSVIIELAATIHWLKSKEKVIDWKNELVKRKAAKATDDNIQKASQLLTSIGL